MEKSMITAKVTVSIRIVYMVYDCGILANSMRLSMYQHSNPTPTRAVDASVPPLALFYCLR